MPMQTSSKSFEPTLSVVIPVHNEAGNIARLLAETCAALRGICRFEIVCVDDGSSDYSMAVLRDAMLAVPELRVLCHAQCSGQSAALRTGIKAAHATWIATLDGDGQNDPADLPRLWLQRLNSPFEIKLFAGWRTVRRDSWSKRLGSRFANAVRQRLLGDATPDTGCGIKLFERAAFLDLPAFNHMHRYLPALMQAQGHQTVSVVVSHRARQAGQSNYTNWGRLRVGLVDLMGVAWLIRRRVSVASSEVPNRPHHVAELTRKTGISR